MKKAVAIHQPNFFPWLGYFDKIVNSDYFVFLDDAQMQKKGGTWNNRVKINVSGQASWITAPIVRNYSGFKLLNQIEFNENEDWREKLSRTVMMNYKKAPYYEEVAEWFYPLLINKEHRLAEYNINCIQEILTRMSLSTDHIFMSSNLGIESQATERLIQITKHLGADIYRCGGGSSGYQEDDLFENYGIELCYQNFSHPKYPQKNTNEFIPGLSILDALFNLGTEKTREVIKEGSGTI